MGKSQKQCCIRKVRLQKYYRIWHKQMQQKSMHGQHTHQFQTSGLPLERERRKERGKERSKRGAKFQVPEHFISETEREISEANVTKY